jgi:chaperonin GroES
MQTETVTAKKGRSKKPTLNGECEHHDKGINPSAPLNASGIHPFEFKVLVKPDEFQRITKGGIIIPDPVVDMEKRAVYRGTLIDLSPTAFSYETWPEGTVLPKPGDKVLFGKYAGTTVKGKDGEEYRVLNDKDVIALLDE